MLFIIVPVVFYNFTSCSFFVCINRDSNPHHRAPLHHIISFPVKDQICPSSVSSATHDTITTACPLLCNCKSTKCKTQTMATTTIATWDLLLHYPWAWPLESTQVVDLVVGFKACLIQTAQSFGFSFKASQSFFNFCCLIQTPEHNLIFLLDPNTTVLFLLSLFDPNITELGSISSLKTEDSY